jgi:aspartate/methionine/tyrosine aminotransferase
MHDPSRRLSQNALRGLDPMRAQSTAVTPCPGLILLHKGDPCFSTPAPVIRAAAEAIEQGFTHYPPPGGDRQLREALAEQLSQRAARRYTSDEILITVGATEALYDILTAYLGPGDQALLFDPSYSLYAPIIRQAGAEPVFVPMDKHFRVDKEQLRQAVTPQTRILICNSPANPTGMVLSTSELDAIAEVAIEADLLVVADEVYDHLIFGNTIFTSTIEHPDLVERTLYVNSFSKTYAMTGWRIGYIAAPRTLLDGPMTIHLNSVNSVNWPTQRAALAALADSQAEVREMIEGYVVRRRRLLNGLLSIPGLTAIEPQGAFYVFARFTNTCSLTSAEVARRLLEGGVAIRSGSEYGRAGEGYLRITFAADLPDIEEGIRRISHVFSALSPELGTKYWEQK